MKNGSNKKKCIIAGLLMFIFLPAFWSWNMPNLINADKPFIDLSGSIGESIGNAQTAYEKAVLTPAPTGEPELTPGPEPTDIPGLDDPEADELRIVIGDVELSGPGESITIEGVKVKGPEELKNLIMSGDYAGKSYILIDYYAESSTYRYIKGFLDESGITYRIVTSEQD